MRKRLIRKFTKAKEGSLGYTLTELLVVIGIIAIVCAIAIPSIIAISRALRFKQRNDYAKSIFLAAQQNLTEMRSDGGLAPLQGTTEEVNSVAIPKNHSGFPESEWSDEYVYTASKLGIIGTQRDTYDLVLPAGSIDGTLREQQVIIEYNPITGNVYAVFYSEEADQDILADYRNTKKGLPRDKERRENMMLGYYCGTGLSSSEIELEKSVAEIEFTNGEEGIVTVKVPMPSVYFGKYNTFVDGLKVTLEVTGSESGAVMEPIVIKNTGADADKCSLDVDGKTILIEYVLDSLVDYGSFANLATGTNDVDSTQRANNKKYLTSLKAGDFTNKILPGENVDLLAEVEFTRSGSNPAVSIEDGILAGVNPMFDFLDNSGTSNGRYTLAVANGRNLQNLNALHPSVADKVDALVFTSDINWNNTVTYYNVNYGTAPQTVDETASIETSEDDEEDTVVSLLNRKYQSMNEAPARALPYFVPIHNEKLFGTAYFTMDAGKYTSILDIIKDLFNGTLGQARSGVPVLTDAYDMKEVNGKTIASSHATIHGDNHRIYNINIDTTKYPTYLLDDNYYAGVTSAVTADVDRFTGLFGYVNTAVNDLFVVNPVVKGYFLQSDATGKPTNNPATGALLGAGGFNTQIRNCGVYLENINWNKANLQDYNAATEQTWYGVSGTGAVGGLVGYCKSHRTVDGNYTKGDDDYLAFSNCFAAVDVSGFMREPSAAYDFGYSNGVGGFIGNSQLTNFYKCYSSGNVRGYNSVRTELYGDNDSYAKYLGLYANGRESYGIGGFVGTSHGTRYTDCFATGAARSGAGYNCDKYYRNVKNNSSVSVGGFVGAMCYDETFAYGMVSSGVTVAQHTVFENCYALGVGKNRKWDGVEGFSGTNGRLDLDRGVIKAYYNADYYVLLAPYYMNYRAKPEYNTDYIFKDSYYLYQPKMYVEGANTQSNHCASPISYSDLLKLLQQRKNDEEVDKWLANVKTWPTNLTAIEPVMKEMFSGFGGFFTVWDEVIKTGPYYEIFFNLAQRLHANEYDLNAIYKAEYGKGFNTNWTTRPHTHYYGDAAGRVYPFPMISGMDYYGTWPTEPLNAGIAYYEEYQLESGNAYGYYMERQDNANLRNDGNNPIVSDGYAIMTASNTQPTVTINGTAIAVTAQGSGTLMDTDKQNQQPYYAWHLNMDAVMNAVSETNGTYGSNYYVPVEITVGSEHYTLYMNPNVAIGQVNDSYSSLAEVPLPDSVKIRTARQFAALGTMDSFWGMDYVQQLNIDAATYYPPNGIPTLAPIGTADAPFTGSYDGNGGYVEMAVLTGFAPAVNANTAGYFGVLGGNVADADGNVSVKGSVSNLTVNQNGANISGAANAGILAGVSNGVINNVTLNASGAVTLTDTDNAGLLVGKTGGSVVNAVVSATGTTYVNATNGAGGVVGYAEGATILDSQVALNGGLSSTAVNAGGFVGGAADSTFQNIKVTGFKRQDLDQKKNLSFNTDNAGGFAGMISGGKVTTVDVALTMENSNSKTGGFMGGAVGVAENGTYTDISTVIPYQGNVIGDTVGGMFGSVTGATVRGSDVMVNHRITGKTKAGGFAGIVGEGDQVIENTFVKVNAGIIGSEGQAAGFAVDFGGKTNGVGVQLGGYGVYNADTGILPVITEQMGSIFGATEVAGFACTVTGQVNTGAVTGNGQICIADLNGVTTAADTGKAAGFAITLGGNGRIAASYVTPAMGNTAADYLGNSNDNLKVKGSSAAGFVMDVTTDVGADNTGIDGSYALCKLEGNHVYGFVGNNAGRINGSMANVTIPVGGYAFTGNNTGMVVNSYGWFGEATANGSPDTTVDFTKYPGHEGETGKYSSCYFIDIKLNEGLSNGMATARLFDNKGVKSDVKASKVRDSLDQLNPSDVGATKEWRVGGTQVSCPYTADLAAEGYPYPELRSHYGNWLIPPQYSYGVAYYEAYDVTPEGSTEKKLEYKIHAINLSKPASGAEVEATTVTYPSATFTANEGKIADAGYVLFCEESATPFKNNIQGAENKNLPVDGINNGTTGKYKFYDFSEKVTGPITVNGSRGLTAYVVPYYADAISVGSSIGAEPAAIASYNIRTEKQLGNVGMMPAADFVQTHSIDVVSENGFTTITEEFSGTLIADKGCTITAIKGNQWMTEVSGTVDVDLTTVGAVTAPIFGDVNGGTITLDNVKMDSIGTEGALVGKVISGSVTTGTVTSGAVDGKLFGEVNGTVETEKITLGAVNGQAFGTVGANGTVTAASIQTEAVAGKLFGDVSGSVTANGGITTGAVGTAGAEGKEAVNGQIFGDVSGSVTVAGISTNSNAVTGQVFGNITSNGSAEAPNSVSVTSISVGDVTGKVFGNVGAAVTVNGAISTGAVGKAKTESTEAVNGQIFGNISATVTTGNITVTSLTGKLAGVISGTLTGGESGSNVNIGTSEARKDMSQNLVGNVNGSFANYSIHAANVTASVIPSVGGDGMVAGVSLNANTATMSTPVLVADNDGSLSGCSVNVGTVTADNVTGPYGVLTNEVAEGKGIEGATVAVDSLTVTNATGNVGILAGQNAGTIDSSTVRAKTEGSTASVTLGGSTVGGLVGVNSSELTGNTVTVGTMSVSGTTVGGLVGKSSGAISGATDVHAEINYTNGSAATIGGMVGEMTGGSITGGTVSGKIIKDSTASGNAYVIGGAVGKDNGTSAVSTTYANISSTVVVDKAWTSQTATISATDPYGKGAVGEFVGYVHNGVFDNCEATNCAGNYHFLGQITVTTKNTAGLVNNDKSIPVFGNATLFTDAQTIDSAVNNETFAGYTPYVNDTHKDYYNYLAKLNDCTIKVGGVVYTQKFETQEYYYSQSNVATNKEYSVIDSVRYKVSEKVTPTLSDIIKETGDITRRKTNFMHEVSGRYYNMYVSKKVETIVVATRVTYTFEYTTDNGATWNSIGSKAIEAILSIPDNNVSCGYGFYTITAVTEAGKQYIIVNGNKQMLVANGTNVATKEYANTFYSENMSMFWQPTDSATNTSWKNVMTGTYLQPNMNTLGNLQNITYSVAPSNGCRETDTAVFVFNGNNYNLYTATETGNFYKKATFTPISLAETTIESDIRCVAKDGEGNTLGMVLAASISEEETVPETTEGPTETTTPAGEAGGEVLGTEG